MNTVRARFLLTAVFCLAFAATSPAQTNDSGAQLREAATRGDLAQVKALLDAGTDVNAATEYGATALSYAADKGHAEVVKLLLSRGAKVDVTDTFYNSTPAAWAGYNGHGEILLLLAEAGADTSSGVMMAITRNKPDGLRPLLAAKKLSEAQLSKALSTAKSTNQAEIVKLLEEAGAKPLPPANAQVDPAILAGYVGEYSGQAMKVTVVLTEAKVLQVSFPGSPPLDLGAENDTSFRVKAFEAVTLVFESEGGAVKRMKIDQGGQAMTLERVATPAAPTVATPPN